MLDSIFRFVHTVKGSCGYLDLPRFMRLSHAAEDVLGKLRSGDLQPSNDLVSAILAVIDRIGRLTDALENGAAIEDNDEILIVALKTVAGNGDADTSKPQILAEFDPHDIETIMEMPEQEVRGKSRSVRISLNLVDKMMNGISDMVLARNEVARQLRNVPGYSELDFAFGGLSSSIAEMREAVEQMRMQNIDRLFSTLPRLMRDIEIGLGKKIELIIESGEVEVDREMAEILRDPLIHIMRNAADHGIEDAETRRAAGKAVNGTIRVAARQSGNQILVEIADDGRGIDIDRLGERAVAAKLIDPRDWQKLSEHEKLNMIFMPGLSTAENVTNISGRGVGMDVVRNNICAVGGSIDLENRPGQGLKMTLRLPLTLSIIAALSVRAGGQNYGISRSLVVEIFSSRNNNVQIMPLGDGEIAVIRGRKFPYARLENILGIAEAEGAVTRTLILVKPAVGAEFVLDVEAVVDTEELVVKPASPVIMSSGLYAGTSLPDTGRPVLLLDMSGIAASMGIEEDGSDFIPARKMAVETEEEKECRSVLLYRALDGRTRAVGVAAVDRIEDVTGSDISRSGGKWRVRNGDRLFDIFGLDDFTDDGIEQEQVTVLLLSDGGRQVYLAVDDVMDIVLIEGAIAPSGDPNEYEGVILVNGDAVELINIFRYFEDMDGPVTSGREKALCVINHDGRWEQQILAPLLRGSGYAVSFDPADRERAQIIIAPEGKTEESEKARGRLIRLRDKMAQTGKKESIYRYDRFGLLAAIEQKIAEGG